MEIDGSGDESAAAAAAATSTDPGRGRKRPPSPSTPTPSDDGEDSDDGWAVSDSGSEEEEEEYDDEEEQEGMHRPFTVDDFPRLSSDHSVQTDALYDIPHLRLRGPSPLSLFRAFNDPLTDKRMHWFDSPEAEDEPIGETLIERCTEFTNILRSASFTKTVRLYGEKCGLDVKFALLVNAVQATVDVEIIHSPACGLNLKLYAKTSGFSDVIRLFRGVAQSGRRIRSLVAVVRRSHLDLCIEGSPADIGLGEKLPCVRWEHKFGAGFHRTADEVVKLGDFTTISVKVTWKAVSIRRGIALQVPEQFVQCSVMHAELQRNVQ
ncbi:Os12g0573700 [Oryza sativa Japonica Group]|uniref:Os12g0573700 protein n=1 Tax=Oryza sativa subsp. japonica TaxID=39947 RepID=Q0IMF0_ORYSJ|nr:Os12g0573700 [Oryza sativa Japonica Group]|eukprot:NP_001067096.2 Os12g0573700 [Oryza sativa Japonica Group]